ncbi:MAG TPA: DNA polymerase/3'-5' exonuclease PolX [Pirellulales bacterium]|jgi:DNA polymerase (family 10)|nr:DNA polymerase/3'-5' exonuclease PolX [Pirellulales bacterium]
MNNAQLAQTFDQLADLLEFQGANPFRVRAYRNAARTIHDYPEPLEQLVNDPRRSVTEIKGIGADLAEKIAVLVRTGSLPMLVELQAEVPPSVLALVRIPGVGPKKAAVLNRELKITTLDELREACLAHRVQALKGFGQKTEELILAGLEIAGQAEARMYWAAADVQAQALLAYLKQCPAVGQLEAAGSYRRGRDTIGDLDFVATATDLTRVMDHFGNFPDVEKVIARGETKMSVRLVNGPQVDLRVVSTESFGAALQYFTGSKDHNVTLRGMAKSRGLKINEYGVFRLQGDEETYLAGRTEADVYAALELPLFPPELREGRQEFDWAAAGTLPPLVETSDIVGDLHMHTHETDGSASLEEMVAAAQARGLKYIAITDHSKRVSMANGLDETRLRRQWEKIDRLNETLADFVVLKGCEVDILERGGLDIQDEALAEADWIVVSVHYGQKQPRDEITKRIVDALQNPYVSAIAHPTGRILNRRKPYEVDLEAVFAAARANRKLLEINANPARLDLDDVSAARAKQHGLRLVVSTDAHSPTGLDCLRYGILQARRAGLTKDDVANTRSWPELKKLLRNG